MKEGSNGREQMRKEGEWWRRSLNNLHHSPSFFICSLLLLPSFILLFAHSHLYSPSSSLPLFFHLFSPITSFFHSFICPFSLTFSFFITPPLFSSVLSCYFLLSFFYLLILFFFAAHFIIVFLKPYINNSLSLPYFFSCFFVNYSSYSLPSLVTVLFLVGYLQRSGRILSLFTCKCWL